MKPSCLRGLRRAWSTMVRGALIALGIAGPAAADTVPFMTPGAYRFEY